MGARNLNIVSASHKTWHSFVNPKKFLRHVKEEGGILYINVKIKGGHLIIDDFPKKVNHTSLVKTWSKIDIILKSNHPQIKRKENGNNRSYNDILEC
jgi:hypothetical protein